jgi:hypothetical protein
VRVLALPPRPPPRLPRPPPLTQFIVFIARVIGSALASGPFAELEAFSSDSIARLAKRACAEFPLWCVDASQVELFAVTKAGKAPSPAEIEAALLLEPLSPFDTLADAGIVSGFCILARVPPPPAAAPGASRRRAGGHRVLSLTHLRRAPLTYAPLSPARSPPPPLILYAVLSLRSSCGGRGWCGKRRQQLAA